MLHESRRLEVELATVRNVRSLEVDVADEELEVWSRDEVASLHPGKTLTTELASLIKVERMKDYGKKAKSLRKILEKRKEGCLKKVENIQPKFEIHIFTYFHTSK